MEEPLVIGRYVLHDELASGGMARVHFGRMTGPEGFARHVVIKRLHPHFAKDPEFVEMFLDEAKIAARIMHQNVVPTLDVVQSDGEVFIVMDYVDGEALGRLVRESAVRGETIPPAIAATILSGVLHGLHAAHETKGPDGALLGVVHRDVSPQNILIGADGVPRLLDFGIAKALGRSRTTRDGVVKGKLGYMAPEQLRGPVSRSVDIYAASVVLWELLTGRRLFAGGPGAERKPGDVPPPSSIVPEVPEALDAIVARGLDVDPSARFATARAMALELERATTLAPASAVGAWVEELAGPVLESRRELLAEIESASRSRLPLPRAPAPAVEEQRTETIAGGDERERKRPRVVPLLAAAAVLAIAGGGIVLARTDPPAVASGDVEPSPASEPAEVAPNDEPAVAPPASSTEAVVRRKEAPPTAAASTAHASAARRPRIVPSRASRSCDPPFRVDSNGHKIPKPECF